MVLPQSFYQQKTLKIAQDLLGCFLVRKMGKKIIKVKIVETEAYNGPHDKASHASIGLTQRNKPMFLAGGFIYIYLTYGIHYMFNIVTEKEGYPAAVLIRAVEPVEYNFDIKNLKFNGPARLTRALKIEKSFNALPIFIKKHNLWLEKGDSKDFKIVRAKRIGIDYAGEPYKSKKWRFYIKDNRFVSKY